MVSVDLRLSCSVGGGHCEIEWGARFEMSQFGGRDFDAFAKETQLAGYKETPMQKVTVAQQLPPHAVCRSRVYDQTTRTVKRFC
jgi:hypothetical protein